MQLVHAPIGRLSPDRPDMYRLMSGPVRAKRRKSRTKPDMSGMSGRQICIPRYGTQGPSGSQQQNAGRGYRDMSGFVRLFLLLALRRPIGGMH
jgi:hypothetical protein